MKNCTFLILLILCGYVAVGQNGLTITSGNRLLLNTSSQIGSADFTLRSASSFGFGGMYVESINQENGRPFYGYAINEGIAAYHFYDASDNRWKLFSGLGNPTSAIEIDESNKFYLNSTSQINSFTDLTLTTNGMYFGGMYINSPGTTSGAPFYGYAIGGIGRAYHYYDASDNKWKLYAGQSNFRNAIEIDESNKFYLNTSTQVNSFSDLTLTTNGMGFGGMYINSLGMTEGRPFYGYAIEGVEQAYHYYDISDHKWKLYAGEVNGKNALEIDSNNLIHIENKIMLGEKSALNSDPNGTIIFTGNGFYGKKGGVWFRLDANVPSSPNTKDPNRNNITLRNRIKTLEERIAILESRLRDINK